MLNTLENVPNVSKTFQIGPKIAKQKVTKKMFGNISKCSKKLFA